MTPTSRMQDAPSLRAGQPWRMASLVVTWLALMSCATVGRADPCAHAQSQVDVNACLGQDAAAIEGRLDSLVSELQVRLPAAERAQLDTVQELWRAYRQGQCAWETAPFAGGSIQPALRAECQAAHARARLNELAPMLCEGVGRTRACPASRRYVEPRRL